MHYRLFRTAIGASALFATASLGAAQTNISGALSGTLTTGVYHCTGNISVATGQSLVIQPGVVIKFGIDQSFAIDGTLTVNGTSGSKVVFTDINDDTVGGDSNGNGGATTPAANWWRGLSFTADSDASVATHFEVRYAGRNSSASVELSASDADFSNGLIRNGSTNGIDLNGVAALPTVASCDVQSHAGAAMVGVPIDSLPGFTGNVASGNGGNYLALGTGTLGADIAVGPSNGIGGAVYAPVNIAVPASRTLTVNAGTVFKFSIDAAVTVDGTLLCNGATGNRVVFTDISDDTAGGDTNSNGASTGAPNWWRGVTLNGGAGASSLTYAEVRFAGRNSFAGIEIQGSNPTLSNCTVASCSGNGIDLNNSVAFPTVSNCTVTGCGTAIASVRIDSLPGFANNAASGNVFNGLHVSNATLSASRTIVPANGINGVIYTDANIAVPTGMVLTLQAGTIVKVGLDVTVIVDGTLTCNGSGGSKVVFTALADDSAGGDTNTNGASSGAANWWRGIVLNAGAGASNLTHTEVRYGGRNGFALVEITTSNPTLVSCKLRNSQIHALDLNGSAAYPTITGCSFENNTGYAVRGVRLDSVPGFSANTATGNGANLIEVTNGTIAADTTIAATNGLSGTLYIETNIVVPAGLTLAFQPNVKLKMTLDAGVYVSGTLTAAGTSGSNVIFTDINDDSVGGDTNGNGGASAPSANWWRGLVFDATSDASSIDFFEVRYCGRNSYAAIEITDADISVTRGIVRNFHANGIDLNSSAARPRINRCLIENGMGRAITNVQIESVPFITRNTATGNQLNHMLVTTGTPANDLYLQGGLGVNDVIVMTANITVPAGRTLRLGPGAAIKFDLDQLVTINGALKVEGTAAQPVIFTDYNDDSIGGDSNGNGGATVPAANWWRGVSIASAADPSSLEHLHVRYSGRNGYAGINCASPLARLAHCRVDRTQVQGFRLSAAARASHLVAWNALGSGFQLDGGAFDLVHATANGCAIGVLKNGAGWTGSVVSSIAFGNTTNFSGLTSSQVRYSTAFTGGGAGNLTADPLFTNATVGDLTLQALSPCLNAGDPFLDDDSDCSAPDMGAYPGVLTTVAPHTYCVGKANSAGCTPFMAASGFASASSSEPFFARCYSVVNQKTGIFYYGFNGPLSAPFQGGTKCVAPPTIRLPLMNSGGTVGGNDCTGTYEFDFNARIQGGLDPQLVPGATVNVQCWYRDPAMPSATGLSDGLQFDICN